MRESTVEKYLTKKVKEAGGICLKFVSPGRKNVPDRLVSIPHRYGPDIFLVETKAPDKGVTAGQQREHDRLRECGLRVFVVNSLEAADLLIYEVG